MNSAQSGTFRIGTVFYTMQEHVLYKIILIENEWMDPKTYMFGIGSIDN